MASLAVKVRVITSPSVANEVFRLSEAIDTFDRVAELLNVTLPEPVITGTPLSSDESEKFIT